MKIKILLIAFAAIAMFLMLSYINKDTGEYQEITYYSFNNDGELERPQNYRTWVYVGTPTTPNDMNDGKAPFPEFHNVYVDPTSYDHWKRNGTWRDGTILIKELVSVGTKSAVSGNGYFMGEFIGLEATIKSKERFPNEPGNWAYFSFTNPGGDLKATGKAFDSNMCNACHAANAQDDFVFTQHYPVLSAAKAVGEGVVPEDVAARGSVESLSFSDAGTWDPTAPTPKNGNFDVPLDKDALFTYLISKKYQEFKNQESKMHPSLGPHTNLGLPVKVYMNDKISESLKTGNQEHPMGSAIVKEMFDKDERLSGWAVMVKTQDKSNDGKGWFWYEVTSVEDKNSIAAIGNGVKGCVACHGIGKDQVRTTFPLK
ncbi:MAG: cytochrome P460 family protein [Allomuricauda sp.]